MPIPSQPTTCFGTTWSIARAVTLTAIPPYSPIRCWMRNISCSRAVRPLKLVPPTLSGTAKSSWIFHQALSPAPPPTWERTRRTHTRPTQPLLRCFAGRGLTWVLSLQIVQGPSQKSDSSRYGQQWDEQVIESKSTFVFFTSSVGMGRATHRVVSSYQQYHGKPNLPLLCHSPNGRD